MTKSDLRKLYLHKRMSLSSGELAAKSSQIAERFFESFDLLSVKYLHCFISIAKFSEIDTKPIFQRVWNNFPNIQTVVPRIDQDRGELESLVYGPATEMAVGRWQISEPAHNETVEAGKIDLVLVPLLCFDRLGHRVGYGKGYYDRFLSRCRPSCLKIGLSYFEPVDKITDAHSGDIKLDFAISPDQIFPFLHG